MHRLIRSNQEIHKIASFVGQLYNVFMQNVPCACRIGWFFFCSFNRMPLTTIETLFSYKLIKIVSSDIIWRCQMPWHRGFISNQHMIVLIFLSAAIRLGENSIRIVFEIWLANIKCNRTWIRSRIWSRTFESVLNLNSCTHLNCNFNLNYSSNVSYSSTNCLGHLRLKR